MTLEESVREFRAVVKNAVTQVPPNLMGTFQRALCLKALNKLIFRTAVDTGRARGNWQVSVSQDGRSKKPMTRLDKGGQAALSSGSEKIGKLPPYCAVYLHNNVPYIVRLEDGSSKKSPDGMLRPTLVELSAELK